jgi:tetrapyrrole methylase family protein/MazG family protein
MSEDTVTGDFNQLKEIIARLRGPDGCPWDKKQTHISLQPYLLEESYEVLQALDEGVPEKLCSELGDLLLQIVLHAQVAAENNEFTMDDVVTSISAKLVHRHPHVFGGQGAKDLKEIEQNWERLKQEQREEGESLLSTMPHQMPSLTYSQSVQRRVASVGFDWDKAEDILEKLTEEVGELMRAADEKEKAREFGDILFTLANIARRMDIDLESSLHAANQRFFNRFTYMEQLCRERGLNLAELTLKEQDALWDEAKRKGK